MKQAFDADSVRLNPFHEGLVTMLTSTNLLQKERNKHIRLTEVVLRTITTNSCKNKQLMKTLICLLPMTSKCLKRENLLFTPPPSKVYKHIFVEGKPNALFLVCKNVTIIICFFLPNNAQSMIFTLPRYFQVSTCTPYP